MRLTTAMFLLLCISYCTGRNINLGNFSFNFRGETYTAHYVVNDTFASYGSGCNGDHVLAIYPANTSIDEFFGEIPDGFSCFAGGKRYRPYDRETGEIFDVDRAEERKRWMWEFNGGTEIISDELWYESEPNNRGKGDENFVGLFRNRIAPVHDISGVPRGHCCMKILSVCHPPCERGRCTAPNVCECPEGEKCPADIIRLEKRVGAAEQDLVRLQLVGMELEERKRDITKIKQRMNVADRELGQLQRVRKELEEWKAESNSRDGFLILLSLVMVALGISLIVFLILAACMIRMRSARRGERIERYECIPTTQSHSTTSTSGKSGLEIITRGTGTSSNSFMVVAGGYEDPRGNSESSR